MLVAMNGDRLLVEDQLCCFRFGWYITFELDNDIFFVRMPCSMRNATCPLVPRYISGDMHPAQVVAGIVFSNAHQSGADQL